MNATNKFNGRAKDYAESRPCYSADLIDCLCNQYGISETSVIADIGSGTGKFSKQLLDKHSEVYCVEPNNDMRFTAEKELYKYTNFHSVAGNAENTTLKDNFADCVTAAQSFHWFNVPKFKQECLRIIKPCGKIFLIWNIRDCNNDINREWYDIFSHFCPNFCGFGNGIQSHDAKIITFFDKGYEYVSYYHPLIFNRENFIKRSLSSSYSLKENDTDFSLYISELNKLFDRFENNGLITISNQSVAYIGTIK